MSVAPTTGPLFQSGAKCQAQALSRNSLRFGQIRLLAGDQPDQGRGFRHAGNPPANVLSVAPLVGLVGGAQLGFGIAIRDRLGWEREREVILVEVGFDSPESPGTRTGGAIPAKGLLAFGQHRCSRRHSRDVGVWGHRRLSEQTTGGSQDCAADQGRPRTFRGREKVVHNEWTSGFWAAAWFRLYKPPR